MELFKHYLLLFKLRICEYVYYLLRAFYILFYYYLFHIITIYIVYMRGDHRWNMEKSDKIEQLENKEIDSYTLSFLTYDQ